MANITPESAKVALSAPKITVLLGAFSNDSTIDFAISLLRFFGCFVCKCRAFVPSHFGYVLYRSVGCASITLTTAQQLATLQILV